MSPEKLPLELEGISFPDALNNLMYWQERKASLSIYQLEERQEAKRLISYWQPRARLIAEVNQLTLTPTQKEILYGSGRALSAFRLPQPSKKRVSQVVGFGVGVLLALVAPFESSDKENESFYSFAPPAEAAKYSDKPATRYERRLLWAIKSCESSGNYRAISQGGAYGAYQVYSITWERYESKRALKGASKQIQDRTALRLLRDQGYKAWTVCGPQALAAVEPTN